MTGAVMSSDRWVPGRSNEEIRRAADRTKSETRVSGVRPVNIFRLVQADSVLTSFGRKPLKFIVVDDEKLGKVDAKTETVNGVVTITCKKGVRDRAELGVGRDRMTLAHEYGHAVMHYGVPFLRETEALGIADATIPPYFSAEHHAKVFASAFLIHDEDATNMVAAALQDSDDKDAVIQAAGQQIAVEFGVSLEAGKVCADRLLRKIKHQQKAARVRQSADKTIAALQGKQTQLQPRHLDHPCPSCHLKLLLPIGNKVLCDNENCGYVGDLFQDGDSAV